MISRRGQRAARATRHERGVSLIDTMVAIALMSVSIVVIVGGFANGARSAAVASDQTQLEGAMRNLADWVRSDAIPYTYCASDLSGTYTTALQSAISSGQIQQFNSAQFPTVTVSAMHADANSAVVNGTTHESSLTNSCTDYGIQRLQITITSTTGRSLSQVVFKGAGLTPPNSSPGGSGGAGQVVSINCTPSPSSGEPYIFYVGGKNTTPPKCAVIEPADGVITGGSTIGAVYDDERDINKTGGVINGVTTSKPTFVVDNTFTYTVGDPINPLMLVYQNQQWVYKLTITLPTNLAPGTHTAVVSAWDTDQNKGGDFGKTTFNFTTS